MTRCEGISVRDGTLSKGISVCDGTLSKVSADHEKPDKKRVTNTVTHRYNRPQINQNMNMYTLFLHVLSYHKAEQPIILFKINKFDKY